MNRFNILFLLFLFFLSACNNKTSGHSATVVQTPQEMKTAVTTLIRSGLQNLSDSVRLNDSVPLLAPALLQQQYEKNGYAPFWSDQEKWLPAADSLIQFIAQARNFGLYPEFYHYQEIDSVNKMFQADSAATGARKNADYWSQTDMLLTDAFFGLIHDIKLGRLPLDSISLRKDSVLPDEFYLSQFEQFRNGGEINRIAAALEPKLKGYQQIKTALPAWLATMNTKPYTKVPDPKKDLQAFKAALQKRLSEDGLLADSVLVDSAHLSEAIKKFQKLKNLNVDGRAGEGTIRIMNTDDADKFARVAITMDRYKLLQNDMPDRYILVNTSGNYLELFEMDTVRLFSKTICGKTLTRTPLLNSAISELITYPQWVPPPSIIQKEILPAVKRNPAYLQKKGFSLVDANGDEVDPFTVDWSKYSKSIPYRVVQGSGDANALGIMKFVFPNKYSVYLHDTNQRYLFGNAQRNMSHGCVRVQEWEKLALYIIRTDSIRSRGASYTPKDSLYAWLKNKIKKSVPVRNKLPVFIRYFTCSGRDGKLVFFDDVYGEDKYLREKYYMYAFRRP